MILSENIFFVYCSMFKIRWEKKIVVRLAAIAQKYFLPDLPKKKEEKKNA